MPETAEKISRGFNTALRDFDGLTGFGACVAEGTRVAEKPEMLFARLDEKAVMEKAEAIMEAQRKAAAAASGAPQEAEEEKKEEAEDQELVLKPEISYEDFEKLQFAVGEVVSCEAVPKSKKLLCSQVKIGSETRQILSGIRGSYSPEEMVGKKVMVLVNLKPRDLAGLRSEGMLLLAEDGRGGYTLMTPEDPETLSGGAIS